MSNRSGHPRLPSLSAITVAFVAVSALIGLAIAYVLISERARAFEQASLQRALETRTLGIQTALSQALNREWTNLNVVRLGAGVLTPGELQSRLNSLVGAGDVVSWAGYAATDGTVIAASNGLLVGENVAARPWFREGLKGPYAGDAHEAVLLAARLPARSQPLRFIDFAVPLQDDDGAVRGVLGVHLDAAWVSRLITEMADAMNVGVVVVGPQGTISASSIPDLPDIQALESLQRARAGAVGTSLEPWPDGRSYFTLTVPELDYPDLPRFGWSFVSRIDGEAATVPAREMSDYLILRLAGLGAMLLLLTALYVVAFIRPFARLAANAMEIADGHDTYPMESNRTREISVLSAALARLQANMHRHE